MAGKEDDAVRKAVAGFYRALNAMFAGDSEPMAAVWSHADDVTYLDAGTGIHRGWDEVAASWRQQADLRLGGEIRLVGEARVTIGADLAVAHCRVEGHNFDARGQRLTVNIRDSQVYRREMGDWKMISHHADPLPYLSD